MQDMDMAHTGTMTIRRQWASLAILLLIATSCYVDRGIVSVLLEPIKEEFSLSDVQLGLLSGPPFAICYALFSIPLGRLADSTSQRGVLLLSLLTWSLLTGLSGFATSVAMLVILRMGVGAAESGAIPPAHALLAIYFGPQRRALAFSIFAAAPMLGIAIANGMGGWVTQHFGWRSAYFAIALIGPPIAILGMLVLPVPPRPTSQSVSIAKPRIAKEIKALLAKPTFRLTIAASMLIAFFNNALNTFGPSMLIRSHGYSTAEAGALFGGTSLFGSLAGMGVAAYFSISLSKRGAAPLLKSSMWCMMIAAVSSILALSSHGTIALVIGLGCTAATLTACLPPLFSTIQHVCGQSRRALADAFNLSAALAMGVALGPTVTGLLSKHFSGMGADSLRFALVTNILALILAGLMIFLAARSVDADAE